MKVKSIAAATLLVASTAWTPVFAADLGGDCCADLEERVAELEATTARKGNRKVSLTVSGWVNEAVTYWDDGYESNVYQLTNMQSQTRFRFTGNAKISADWSAGYVLELGVAGSRSDGVDADNDDNGSGVSVRVSAWYLDSKTLGRVSVGQQSTATDGLLDSHIANLGHVFGENGAAQVGAFRLGHDGNRINSFMGGANAAGTAGTDSGQIGEGNRMNVVRYDTPSIAGFKLSASWGEDDQWDAALRYAGEFGGFKLAMNVGYQQIRDGNGSTPVSERNCVVGKDGVPGDNPDIDCEQAGIWGGLMHVPTGLFAEGGYGVRWDNNVAPGYDDSSTQWFVVAGIEQKFFPLGKTTIWGEYQRWDVGMTQSGWNAPGSEDPYDSAKLRAWGFGINQQIDAAAMDIYLFYRNYDGSNRYDDGEDVTNRNYKSFQQITAGGRIQF
ncbi:MAG: porin [Hyphomicrobiaceae bacterium]